MKSINSICVVGAGSIGSLYAGFLASVAEVKILTCREEHAHALTRQGLRVTGKTKRHVKVDASTKPTDLGAVDLVIIATKTFDVEAAAGRLSEQFPNALLMLAQNGLGCEKSVAKFGDWPIISAVTFMAGTRHSDTHVEYELDTATWLGPWNESTASFQDAQAVAHLLLESGLQARAFHDLLPAQWSKLIFNAVVNSVAALTDLPFSELFVQRNSPSDLGHLVYEAISEGKRVAAAYGVTLHEDPWEMCLQAAGRTTKEAGDGRVPSMLVDIRAGRRTEIDWITGAIVNRATDAGIDVPVNSTLYRLVKARETS